MKDLVIGIPSLNNEKTVSHVAQQIAFGLLKYFPDQKALILNVDGGSADKTVEIFLKTKTPGIEKISLKEPKPHGKGSAQKVLFETIAKEKAKAGATFDGDLRSITSEWVKEMLKPVLDKGFDYVTPLYLRHKFDGTITNTLAYPLNAALYGQEIRQPIGGDFAFSGKLVKTWLSKSPHMRDPALAGEIPSDFGIDIFMTTTAIAKNFKICQVELGPKIHDPKDPNELQPMFIQVASQLFKLARIYQDKWQRVDRILKVPIFGQKSQQKPPLIKIDLKKLKEYDRISQEAWVTTVYDFLLSKKPAKGLVSSYLKACASLIFENWQPEDLAKEYLRQKQSLISKLEPK